jgi:ABC-type branched-subunit amino acid transport system ATPase component
MDAGNEPIRSGGHLKVARLTKHFSGVLALSGVEFEVAPGEAVGVFGPNGSGKTTLVNCISGVLPPSAGKVFLDDREVTTLSRVARARLGIVRTYQNLRLFNDLTVIENVQTGLAARQDLRAGEKRVRLDLVIDHHQLAHCAYQRVGDLPYGMQKRTEVARALIAEPRLLLLDEPAAGLGDEEAHTLEELLVMARRRHRFAMVLIDHNTRFVSSLANRLIVLSDGQIIRNGAPADILADPEVARIYFGSDVVAAG